MSRKKYEIHAEEINNRRNSAPKWTQRNWFTRIYIHYSRASNLIVVEHPELASLFTINKRIYRSRFTKISSHGYTLLRWDESRQYSRVGGGTPETRVAFLYCSRMCRTSTVFITVCAPFSKRRILLREPPTPQDDDSLVHRPPPPGQGASRRRLRLYIYTSAAPISLSNKTKGNCCESYPSDPPSGRSSLDPPLLRRSWCSPLSPNPLYLWNWISPRGGDAWVVESHLNLGLFSGGWVTCFDRKFIFLFLSFFSFIFDFGEAFCFR